MINNGGNISRLILAQYTGAESVGIVSFGQVVVNIGESNVPFSIA